MPLYERIDRLRNAITSRAAEVEKLINERDAFDHAVVVRGIVVWVTVVVLLIAAIVAITTMV